MLSDLGKTDQYGVVSTAAGCLGPSVRRTEGQPCFPCPPLCGGPHVTAVPPLRTASLVPLSLPLAWPGTVSFSPLGNKCPLFQNAHSNLASSLTIVPYFRLSLRQEPWNQYREKCVWSVPLLCLLISHNLHLLFCPLRSGQERKENKNESAEAHSSVLFNLLLCPSPEAPGTSVLLWTVSVCSSKIPLPAPSAHHTLSVAVYPHWAVDSKSEHLSLSALPTRCFIPPGSFFCSPLGPAAASCFLLRRLICHENPPSPLTFRCCQNATTSVFDQIAQAVLPRISPSQFSRQMVGACVCMFQAHGQTFHTCPRTLSRLACEAQRGATLVSSVQRLGVSRANLVSDHFLANTTLSSLRGKRGGHFIGYQNSLQGILCIASLCKYLVFPSGLLRVREFELVLS